ncbi:MAG: sugar-binding transcriptional regulator [Lachnospiraceae bacterium]|nr:sugar-binding transcriptional regulator [Lachnospiraceae bacterium]
MENNLDYEEVLMAKTAWYYYSDNLTQQQISDLLGVNRMRVIKLLDKAKQCGIIQFKIRSDSEKRMEIEQLLMKQFGLKDCFIVPSPMAVEDINENIAKAASMYICNRLTDESFINVGYGDTSSRILNHLAISTEHTLSCVSLTGGVSYYLPNANSSTFNSRLYLIPTPLLASTNEMAAAMKTEKSVKDIEQLIPLSCLSVIGIGSMDDEATILKSGILTKNDFLFLTRNGAVGDVLSHFINEDGEIVKSGLEDRTISTPLETLKKLDNVIGVAAGENKVTAIRAALHGKYLDILITDEDTANALVSGENVSL